MTVPDSNHAPQAQSVAESPVALQIELEPQTETARAEGDAYLRRVLKTPLWSLSAWDIPLRVYGRRVERFVARTNGQVVGLTAFVQQKSLLFGNRLVSLPWVDASGLIADTSEVARALSDATVSLAKSRGIGRFILRQNQPAFDWPVERDDKLAMELALTSDPDTLWKSFDPKVRNQVRKAEKSGVQTETLTGEGLAGFYEVYSQNMRDLGSPPHSLPFFQAIIQAFPEEVAIHLARVEGKVVGAGFTMKNGCRLDIPWASSLQEYNRLCINHGLYWHMLKYACLGGFQSFYFGRSTRDSGPHHFKKQWGAHEVPLYWYSLDRSGVPQVDRRPPKESFGLAIRLWKKLPVSMARQLGPWLIAQLD